MEAVVGAVAGAEIHQRLSTRWMVLGFSVFLAVVALDLLAG